MNSKKDLPSLLWEGDFHGHRMSILWGIPKGWCDMLAEGASACLLAKVTKLIHNKEKKRAKRLVKWTDTEHLSWGDSWEEPAQGVYLHLSVPEVALVLWYSC